MRFTLEKHSPNPATAFLLGAGLLIATTGCGTLPSESEANAQSRNSGSQASQSTTAVDVAIARIGTVREQPEYTGTTAPVQAVSLRSQVEGQLVDLSVDVGDSVKRGQIVAQLNETLLVTDLRQAEAELAARKSEVARAQTQVSNARALVEQARLRLGQAQADSQRQQRLFRQGAISAQLAEQTQTTAQTAAQALRAAQEQVRTEQQAVAAAQGRVIAQQAVVAQAKERRSYAQLTSPITGVVLKRAEQGGSRLQPGNLLRPGDEILTLGDFSRVKVVVEVSELELSKIRVGQSVQVRLDAIPNQTFTGQVTRISPVADPTARLVPVEVIISNSNSKIGSGLLARVSFEGQTTERVVVPESAVSQVGRDTVFVVTLGEGKTQATVTDRAVTLGKRANGKVEILSGLKPGERFVARSSTALKHGQAVRVSILSETSKQQEQ